MSLGVSSPAFCTVVHLVFSVSLSSTYSSRPLLCMHACPLPIIQSDRSIKASLTPTLSICMPFLETQKKKRKRKRKKKKIDVQHQGFAGRHRPDY
ncbi:hypothetical protein GGR55DRAFT_297770 [Xylaria sp. FL0064]|nr:hypothetical protein GGR55DRAFT_297770 [Xylaria sp. FL0064]